MASSVDSKEILIGAAPSTDDRPDLVRFLARRLRCRATAEDLVQEAYLRLIQSAATLRSPRAFLFRTVYNLAVNHWRDERRRAELRRDIVQPRSETVDATTPEDTVLVTDDLRLATETFATLPARTREVFVLNRFEGLNQREIAERLDISHTVVEKHMARAVQALTRALKPPVEENPQ